MGDGREAAHRKAFDRWLRTGFVPSPRSPDGIEVKFNPWHDPETGRFTFAGMGVRYGDGGSDVSGAMDERPRRRPVRWQGGGFTGPGGGMGGGAGATATGVWYGPGEIAPRRAARQQPLPPASPRPTETFREVRRNGYLYRIDMQGRTRHVSGALTLAKARRSRREQLAAGGRDRRPFDEGGHYIASRFNGPAEAFNHFAQNANFNRSGYRMLEDEWARDKRAGRVVTVKIAPVFPQASVRPSRINVWWTVDGQPKSQRFPNERKGYRGGR